ncbi:MAG: HEAT repeat domain-containing protein [Candidatus Hydrogenedentes bacterium]|nr:HEAT repeat domain-containing protein [Candidatus Hydrogenedentota bacterium]
MIMKLKPWSRNARTYVPLIAAVLSVFGASLFWTTMQETNRSKPLPPPGIDVDALTDRELLEYLAGDYFRWPIAPLKERASHYTDEQLGELSALIVEIAFPLRPEDEIGLGFLSITDRYLPAEWAYYTEDEGMKRRRDHTQPVVDFVRVQQRLATRNMPVDLEKLRACYIALDDPTQYPQLRPRGSHCGMGDPDVWNLQQDIVEILGKSGVLGVEYLYSLGYSGLQLGKALSEAGRPQDIDALVALVEAAPTPSEKLGYLHFLARSDTTLHTDAATSLLRRLIGRHLKDADPELRQRAVYCAGDLGDVTFLPILEKIAAEDPHTVPAEPKQSNNFTSQEYPVRIAATYMVRKLTEDE